MKLSTGDNTIRLFWLRYRVQLLSIVLALYTLPAAFAYTISPGLDGSWVKAINFAIKNKVKFGTGFIFTYGPLGYISTRDTHYISDIFLFLFDIFLVSCFYYLFSRYLSKYKGWFFIVLVAIFYSKGIEPTSVLFLLFVTFTILNLQNGYKNYFEIVCCAISGITIFFIKINYGVIGLPILLIQLIYLLPNNRKAFLMLFVISATLFITICSCTNIDLLNYVRCGLPVISNYPDAMVIAIDADGPTVIYAIVCITLFAGTLCCYCWQLSKQNAWSFNKAVTIILLNLVLFLVYKNGFTRADGHSTFFFLTVPLFMIFSMWLLDFGSHIAAKWVCIAALIISDINVPLPHGCDGTGFLYNATVAPFTHYCSSLFKKVDYSIDTSFNLTPDKLKIIGKSSMDILPVEISLALQNNLNLDSRPIVQSYSAYSHVLDSLNANHFYQTKRPEFVMLWDCSIDGRYAPWDESLTKAVLHLNYHYVDFISLINDTALNNNFVSGDYLLLKSNHASKEYPKFKKLYEKEVQLEDTTFINFPDDSAVYVTAQIDYHTLGKVKNMLFQPPVLSVSLYFDRACQSGITQKIVKPLLLEPELINKAILGNRDLENFMTGKLDRNKSIKAFAFHAAGRGCKKNIRLTFYKFSNY